MNYNKFLCTRKEYLKMEKEFDCKAKDTVADIDEKVKKWLKNKFPMGDGYNNLWYLDFNSSLTYDLALTMKFFAYNTGYLDHWDEIKEKVKNIVEKDYPFIRKIETSVY